MIQTGIQYTVMSFTLLVTVCFSNNLLILLWRGLPCLRITTLKKLHFFSKHLAMKADSSAEAAWRTHEGQRSQGEGDEQVKGDTKRARKTLKWHVRRCTAR